MKRREVIQPEPPTRPPNIPPPAPICTPPSADRILSEVETMINRESPPQFEADGTRSTIPQMLEHLIVRQSRRQFNAEKDYFGMEAEFIRRDQEYRELRDAICSESWARRDDHESVVKLARRLRDKQEKLYAK